MKFLYKKHEHNTNRFYIVLNLYIFLESRLLTAFDKETTITRIPFFRFNQKLNLTSKARKEDTTTVQEHHKINGNNWNQSIENRIQTNWQLMIIMLAILTVLTCTYLGKCVQRHWISRTLRLSIRNTTPTIALGDRNQTENSYDRVQSREYEEPQRYQTAAGDAFGQHIDILNHENSPENMETVSCRLEDGPRREMSLNWINTNRKDHLENQPDTEELNDLYITPCM